MKLSPRMLAATIAATMFASGLMTSGEAQARRNDPSSEAAQEALSPEKKLKYDALLKTFAERTAPLKEKIRAKRLELDALSRSPQLNVEAVRSASEELAALETRMDKERADLREQIGKETGFKLPPRSAYGSAHGHPGHRLRRHGGCPAAMELPDCCDAFHDVHRRPHRSHRGMMPN